jgi:2,4-diaminopentanoate dehydrogenase
MRLHLVVGSHHEDHAEQGCLATAMHAVNAIPTVLTAEPGVYDLTSIKPFVAQWTNCASSTSV